MTSVKRFTDTDSQLLRRMIKDYGIDGLCQEIHAMIKSWRSQNAKIYSLLERRAASLNYAAKLLMGKAPLLQKKGN